MCLCTDVRVQFDQSSNIKCMFFCRNIDCSLSGWKGAFQVSENSSYSSSSNPQACLSYVLFETTLNKWLSIPPPLREPVHNDFQEQENTPAELAFSLISPLPARRLQQTFRLKTRRSRQHFFFEGALPPRLSQCEPYQVVFPSPPCFVL